MRKADREIKDRGEIIKLLDECQTMRLALHDEPYPYVVPFLSDGNKLTADFMCIFTAQKKEKS